MREEKQLDFITQNQSLIMEEYLKNENSVGYVQIYADNDFKLIPNSIRFIKGDFNRNEFLKIGTLLKTESIENLKKVSENIENEFLSDTEIIEADFCYCEILWFDNKTKWNLKSMILTGKSK